jgi:hypothetical protein
MSIFLFDLTLKVKLMYYELQITSNKKNYVTTQASIKTELYNPHTNFHIAKPSATDQCCQYTHITAESKINVKGPLLPPNRIFIQFYYTVHFKTSVLKMYSIIFNSFISVQ